VRPLDPQEVLRTSILELRGDGKAGGGLVLAFQSLAALMSNDPGLHVQEWPFFSSARRGANIRSFLRVSARPISAACELTRPSIALLMDEAAARSVDFAQGVPVGGTFVLNTRRTPLECAKHFHLSGRVFTVPGDDLGTRYLKAPIGNVSAYVAMAHAIGGFARDQVVETFLKQLKKRRIPEALIERNREALGASFDAIQTGTYDEARPGDHMAPMFEGYGELPVGAQTRLRLSATNRTSDYAKSGFRLVFEDPDLKCTGCAHCITSCPEGIIRWQPDDERGVLVTGADVSSFCKLCGECIAVCPEALFKEGAYEEKWEEVEA
jgi:2-oxoacid:acceptor oxidoreductase gamma subunit (pyruvate/2-ketoisovalerate family)